MEKIREILLSTFFVLSLLTVSGAYPNVFWITTITLVLLTKGYQRMTLKNCVLIALLILLCFDAIIRRKTLINNYIILGVYLSTFFDGGIKISSTRIYIMLDFIVILNIILLLIYPGATKWLNYPDLWSAYGYPIWVRFLLINTVGSFVILIMTLYRRSLARIILTLLFLSLATKTTSLVLFVSALIFVYISVKNVLIYSIPIAVICIIIWRLNLLDTYVMERLSALWSLDFQGEYFSRVLLGKNSYLTFIQNPILGIGYHRIDFDDHQVLFSESIGHHSHLLDFLGRYGLCFVPILFLEIYRYIGVVRLVVFFWLLLNNIIGIEWIIFVLILPSLIDSNEDNAFSSGLERRWS